MGFSFRIATVICMVLVFGCVLMSCQGREPLKIGFVGGLTGRNGDLGTAGRDGAQLAIDTINAAGGIMGRMLELVVRDDKNDPDEAKRSVNELADAKVVAIVGPMTSAMAAATIPITDGARLLMLSPTVAGSGKDFTGRDDYFIRLIMNSNTATATAERMVSRLGIRRAAVVYDISNKSFTTSLVDTYKAKLLSLGGAVVVERTFDGKEKTDLMADAKALVGQGVQGILIVAGAVDSAMICQQLKKLGSTVPVFIAEWGGTNEFIKAGGRAVDGVYVFQHFNSDSTSPPFLAFKAAYVKRFGDAPSFAATYGYEAVSVIAEALKKNPDVSRIKETIIGVSHFNGLQGAIDLDRFGDAVRPFSLMQVRDGRFVRME